MVRVDVVKKTSGKGGNKWWWWTWTARWWATATTSKPTATSRTWVATTWRFNCPNLNKIRTILSAPFDGILTNVNSFIYLIQWGQKLRAPDSSGNGWSRWRRGGRLAGWQVGSGNLPGVDEKAASSQPELLYGKELPFLPHHHHFLSHNKKNICSSFRWYSRLSLLLQINC